MTAIDLLAPEVLVDGSPLTVLQLDALVSVRVELGLCEIGRSTLRFTDPGYALATAGPFALGASVEIKAPSKGRLMAGQVTGISLEQSSTEQPELIVTVDDGGYRLTRGMKPQTYLKMSYADVIKKLVGAAGLTADVPAAVGSTEVSEYLLQTGTALAYIDRIAQRMGMVWWVEDKKLVLKKAGESIGSVELTLGEDLIDFSVRASGLRPTNVIVTGWDPGQQQQIVGSKAAGDGPTAAFLSSYVKSAPDGKLNPDEAITADCAPATQTEATALAGAIVDDGAAGAVIARGTCFANAAVQPAMTVVIDNAGPAKGSYAVSEVVHTYSSQGFLTRFVAGPRRPLGLVDTLGRPAPDPGFMLSGLVVGVVSNNKDPDDLGRVKVEFSALKGNIESTWARVVTLGAGAQRGVVFQPEVKDEVLLGFEYGDTRRPVVIGGLYSKVKGLPEATKIVANDEVAYRRITSRKNHVLEFADGSAATDQHILLKLGTAQHKLRLGADAFDIEVASGKPVSIKAGSASFEISAAGDVTIQGKNVKIKADAEVTIEGINVTAKGSAKTAVQGATVEVKANAMASVESSGPLMLKGALVKVN